MTANGNSFDPMASWARLSERVENQGKDIIDLRSNMNSGFQGVNSNLAALSNEFRSSNKTQWPVIWSAIGVGVVMLSGLGFMALQPIKDNTSRLEEAVIRVSENAQASLKSINDSMVTQKEMEQRTARGVEDRARTDTAVKDLRDAQVPREELIRVWDNYDQRFIDQQRQIDEIKTAQGSIYGQRDVILDLRERLDRIEHPRP